MRAAELPDPGEQESHQEEHEVVGVPGREEEGRLEPEGPAVGAERLEQAHIITVRTFSQFISFLITKF